MRRAALLLLALAAVPMRAERHYPATGLVLKLDRPAKTMVVSCDPIPSYMDAMVMPLTVRDVRLLDGVEPGARIKFSLVVEKNDSFAEAVQVLNYNSVEQEPLQARRLEILSGLAGANSAAGRLKVGDSVPDFSLTDQLRRQVSLAQFSGKVVALNFVYTRCPLPQYCFRMANNFGRLQKRFRERLGKDLVLLTVTFDPIHDQPEVLAEYAKTWKADAKVWHFLTGSQEDVNLLCDWFGVGYWQDEGTLTHSLHTAIIGRDGKLAANLEGNQFTPRQLGDLVQTILERPR